MESHLLQMRGLKQYYIDRITTGLPVASFTDAWIETPLSYGNQMLKGRIFYRCVD